MGSPAEQEIVAMYGAMPQTFAAMKENGELEERWPPIRNLYTNPSPLPREIMDAIMATLGMRCSREYCFVLHSLGLVGAGVDRIALDELHTHLTVPSQVPDHERWTRILRLAWLAAGEGPAKAAARHALEQACTPEEFEQIQHCYEVEGVISSYVERYDIDVQAEPVLAFLPAEMQALVPDFVAFHTRLREGEDERPVATVCCSCAKVRSIKDEQWYPRDTAAELLPEDVMFSHGMCPSCVDEYEHAQSA